MKPARTFSTSEAAVVLGIPPETFRTQLKQGWMPKVIEMKNQAAVDLTKPHWKCRCGVVAMPLTDDTTCKCADVYEQEWSYVSAEDPHV